NKWDHVSEKVSWPALKKSIQERFDFLQFVPFFPISAKSGFGLTRLFREILKAEGESSKRLKTSEVNRVFQKLVEAHPPPMVSGKSLNLFYMTQTSVRPPRFVIFCNHPNLVPEHYKRYLVRGLRSAFSFRGSPLDLEFRARKKKRFHD